MIQIIKSDYLMLPENSWKKDAEKKKPKETNEEFQRILDLETKKLESK